MVFTQYRGGPAPVPRAMLAGAAATTTSPFHIIAASRSLWGANASSFVQSASTAATCSDVAISHARTMPSESATATRRSSRLKAAAEVNGVSDSTPGWKKVPAVGQRGDQATAA